MRSDGGMEKSAKGNILIICYYTPNFRFRHNQHFLEVTMDSGQKISTFFSDKFFEIPRYQRGYAWEKSNVEDLFNDIKEAQESTTGHYIGTIVLACKEPRNEENVYIVDGQQRITTITLLIRELLNRLSEDDRKHYWRNFIKEGEQYKLLPLNRDRLFFADLLDGKEVKPENKSQRSLLAAVETIRNCIDTLSQEEIMPFFKAVQRMEVLSFIEASEGDAIRIFQTVNDRGKPLSSMEKTKALLIYYSNRYLGGELDASINDLFSDVFEAYDDIKQTGETLGINLIKGRDFNEDNLLRYHFVTFSEEDYDPTSTSILLFLRSKLNSKHGQQDELRQFIQCYSTELKEFFVKCREVVGLANSNPYIYKLFVPLGLAARLYPLIVRLHEKGILFDRIFDDGRSDARFINLVELIDVRVYKTRGTDPKADIARLSHRIGKMSNDEIRDNLLAFNQNWMPVEMFSNNLSRYAYGNQALQYIFLTYCEELDKKTYEIEDVKRILQEQPNIEHILAQTPGFDPKAFGFLDAEEFESLQHSIGNLVSLEKKFNSEIKNKVPVEKVNTYSRSTISAARKIGTTISVKMQFKKAEMDARCKELVQFCIERWWCKRPELPPTIVNELSEDASA